MFAMIKWLAIALAVVLIGVGVIAPRVEPTRTMIAARIRGAAAGLLLTAADNRALAQQLRERPELAVQLARWLDDKYFWMNAERVFAYASVFGVGMLVTLIIAVRLYRQAQPVVAHFRTVQADNNALRAHLQHQEQMLSRLEAHYDALQREQRSNGHPDESDDESPWWEHPTRVASTRRLPRAHLN
jgi:hypothetical protein